MCSRLGAIWIGSYGRVRKKENGREIMFQQSFEHCEVAFGGITSVLVLPLVLLGRAGLLGLYCIMLMSFSSSTFLASFRLSFN